MENDVQGAVGGDIRFRDSVVVGNIAHDDDATDLSFGSCQLRTASINGAGTTRCVECHDQDLDNTVGWTDCPLLASCPQPSHAGAGPAPSCRRWPWRSHRPRTGTCEGRRRCVLHGRPRYDAGIEEGAGMKVTASFFGPIRRPWPELSRQIEAAEGTSVGELLADLGYSPEDLKRVAVVVNGRRRDLDTPLADGDDARFALLAGGG